MTASPAPAAPTSAPPLRIARVRPADAPNAQESFFVASGAEDFASPHGQRWTVVETPFPGSPGNAASPSRAGWEAGAEVTQDAFTFLAPCSPSNVLGMAHNTGAAGRALPPQAFHKAATSVIGPGDAIEAPTGARVEPESELTVVIGALARHLTTENAMEAVLGFTIGNDVTDRLAQGRDELWISAKSADTFTPLGPWIVTQRPHDDAGIGVGIDGARLPGGTVADLGWGIEEILVYASSFMTLHPGDVILTGFPGTSGTITAGQHVECRIDGIGTLTNSVVAAP
ncbi:fumarylacetoacetate hydrolase family protein [Sinomonas sp. ASV486]|uniref:fumarylacetoacetate hydrolase family protein n=1 Tax=Sinomonas sp. ASV486 TaxID=3051170 RepID=UPI0027DB6CCB|nr:fumarylacetoacetate hydrolase family protein [Sinomonas sp. ASV486]MDQ4490624.1 fumarylacetoacetate hydrolase family protein [Sinomonas sp. ASV486]